MIDSAGVLESSYLSSPVYYSDASEMLRGLSTAPEVQLCYASKWAEWFTGAPPNGPQRALLSSIAERPGVTVREILLETLTSNMFLERAELER